MKQLKMKPVSQERSNQLKFSKTLVFEEDLERI